jgi:hypothetical protein
VSALVLLRSSLPPSLGIPFPLDRRKAFFPRNYEWLFIRAAKATSSGSDIRDCARRALASYAATRYHGGMSGQRGCERGRGRDERGPRLRHR